MSHSYDANASIVKSIHRRSATYKLVEVGKNAQSEIPEDLDPQRALGLITTAEKLLEDGKFDEAIAEFDRALKFAPSFAAAYDGRGQAFARKGAYEKAIADYKEASRRDPKFPYPVGHLAWLLATCPDAKFRNGKEAVAEATRACELSKWKNAGFLATLAAAHAEAGHFEEAVKWQTKAVNLSVDAEKPDFEKHLKLFKAGEPLRETPKE